MILMFGDVHGDFKHVLQVVQNEQPAAVIFLGDLDLTRPFEQEIAQITKLTEVYFIHGNHDTDDQDKHNFLFNSSLADRNLHNRVVEIDGIKVAGLGGVFRESIWFPKDDVEAKSKYDNYDAFVEAEMQALLWQEMRRKKSLDIAYSGIDNVELVGKRLTHKSTIFYDEWLNLYSQQADILVTHEAPSCHPYGFEAITELARGMQVKRTFHGHHHDRLDYSAHYAKLGFEAHGVGRCGVSDHQGGLVLAGKRDEHRSARKAEMS